VINLERLDEAIAYIEAHPEQHDQRHWFRRSDCGTTACLAGTVAMLGGWRPDFGLFGGNGRTLHVHKDGTRKHVGDVADELLGLSREQSDALFVNATNLDDIRLFRDAIAAGELT